VIRSIIADERGRLWIEAATPQGFAIAVIDAEGRMLGEVPLPTRDARVPLYARGGRLYLVTRDTLDVQSIQVYDTGLP
jgi:sugar lactone lactonase YvrE